MSPTVRRCRVLAAAVLAMSLSPALAQLESPDLPVSPLGPGQVFGNVTQLTPEVQARLDQLAAAVQADPEDAMALARYGLALVRVGRKEDGLAALTRATVKAPDEPTVILLHAKGLWKSGYAGEAVQQALRVTRSPLAAGDDVAEAFFVAGTVRSMQGDYVTGQRYLLDCVERNPNHVGAMVNLGLMLASQGQASEGVRWLEKARLAAPDSLRVQASYAKILDQMGMVDKARGAWERVAELRPDDLQVMANLSHAYMNVQDYQKAAYWLEKVVGLAPDDKLARMFFAEALLRLGRFDDAREQARQAAALGLPVDSLMAAIELEEGQARPASAASTGP